MAELEAEKGVCLGATTCCCCCLRNRAFRAAASETADWSRSEFGMPVVDEADDEEDEEDDDDEADDEVESEGDD